MSTIQTYEDLSAGQKSHALVLKIYRLTKVFPNDELFGLSSQVCRATVSITSNIIEGFNHHSNTEKIRFYNIAESSCEEIYYQLRLAQDLLYSEATQLREVAREISKIIAGLIKSIRSQSA